MALGLTALAPGPALAAFPANINLSALDGTNGFRLSGVAAFDLSGRAVSTAGDVNGDGVDDVLIGALGADPNGDESGDSYVVFGGAGVGNGGNLELSALDGTNGFKLSGAAAGDFSGAAVSTAGDVNGDGIDDLLIGAYRADPNGVTSGASYVVFGGAGVGNGGNLELSALDGTNGFRLSGVAAYDLSGRAVSTAGDVNGDGTDDILIGASGAGPNGDGSGASYVVFGGAGVGNGGNLELSALDGTNGFRLSGVAASDVSGVAVSTAGDVNGDGVDDVLIGALGADPNGDSSGASYVVFGGAG
ncbi:MAG: integrin alpha, partial [Pseudomonadota bacterium]|nr:integrin alpha [Pseudomonadota bacterium]